MVIDLTKLTETPKPLCTPEQFKHKKIPLLTDALILACYTLKLYI
jgi:hypothetical protein